MRLNSGFNAWNQPYLFQKMEQTFSELPSDQKNRVINLGIGDPDLPTPTPVREAIVREHQTKYYGYPTSQGRHDLRDAICRHYDERFGVSMSPEQIFIGPGAKTDLFDLNAVFAEPGDSIVVLDPAYPVYKDAAGFRKQSVCYLTGTLQNNFQPELNVANITDGPLSLIYLCYPNNPTGVSASKAYIQSFVNLAQSLECMIVMDLAYADFVPGNGKSSAFSIFTLPGADSIGIEVGSFSKPYSMTGDRICWVAIKNRDAARHWHRFRSSRDSGVSNYDQAGALAALTDPRVKEIVHSNFEIYGRRADILRNGITSLGFQMTGLDNTPYAWFKIPCNNSIRTAQYLLQHAGIMLTPGVGFGPAGEGFLRATIFQPEERLCEALERMQNLDMTMI
jgi:LL-diaminopimelate aminotransferase